MYNRFKIGITLGVLALTLISCGNSNENSGQEQTTNSDYSESNHSVESMPSSVTDALNDQTQILSQKLKDSII